MDNIRFIAMFCVILGHLLELLFNEKSINFIYREIYSFHMPLFIFCQDILLNLIVERYYIL